MPTFVQTRKSANPARSATRRFVRRWRDRVRPGTFEGDDWQAYDNAWPPKEFEFLSLLDIVGIPTKSALRPGRQAPKRTRSRDAVRKRGGSAICVLRGLFGNFAESLIRLSWPGLEEVRHSDRARASDEA